MTAGSHPARLLPCASKSPTSVGTRARALERRTLNSDMMLIKKLTAGLLFSVRMSNIRVYTASSSILKIVELDEDTREKNEGCFVVKTVYVVDAVEDYTYTGRVSSTTAATSTRGQLPSQGSVSVSSSSASESDCGKC